MQYRMNSTLLTSEKGDLRSMMTHPVLGWPLRWSKEWGPLQAVLLDEMGKTVSNIDFSAYRSPQISRTVSP